MRDDGKNYSMADDNQLLKARIQELESDLEARNQDLAKYRRELKLANEKLETFIGHITRDINILSRLQKSIVPTEFPHIQGFEFSTKFIASPVSGGDYLDIFEHQDRFRFSLLMSSCSGYSISALLLASLLTLSGPFETRKTKSAHQLLQSVFKEVFEMAAKEDCAEIFFAIINRRTYEFEYSLAGNVYAFHFQAEENTLKALDSLTTSLHKGSDLKQIQSQKVKLNSKDRVIICSRGVVSASNLDGQAFGVDRLIKILLAAPKSGVHDLRNEILFQLGQFTGGKQLDYDQSVIIMEVKDRVLKLAT